MSLSLTKYLVVTALWCVLPCLLVVPPTESRADLPGRHDDTSTTITRTARIRPAETNPTSPPMIDTQGVESYPDRLESSTESEEEDAGAYYRSCHHGHWMESDDPSTPSMRVDTVDSIDPPWRLGGDPDTDSLAVDNDDSLVSPYCDEYRPSKERGPTAEPEESRPAVFFTRGCKVEGKRANCSGLNLRRVPQDLPRDIETLNLAENNITELPDRAFARYSNLRRLCLNGNQIHKLSNESFYGLTSLCYLNLASNGLEYRSDNFPEGVFSSLAANLKVLKLTRNNKNITESTLHYPDKAFAKLSNVKVLLMDGLRNKAFGEGFQHMLSLRRLVCRGYVHGYCNIASLKNDTFKYLTQLTYLNLETCFIDGRYIEKGAFLPLSNLIYLSLKHNEDIGVDNLDSVFYGLKNAKQLTCLNLHLVSNRYSLGVCLDSHYIRNIPPSLEYLNVEENNLQAVDRSVIGFLPQGLKILQISGNKFVFGTYLQDLHALKSLTHITLDGTTFVYQIPKVYPYTQPNNTIVGNTKRIGKECNLYDSNGGDSRLLQGTAFKLKFPPRLKHIQMQNAGLTYRLTEWEVDQNNVVETILIGRNTFYDLIGPVKGFNKLKKLSVNSCHVSKIDPTFFDHLTSLEWLNLGDNSIGQYIESSKIPLFSKLSNLTYLDMSSNGINFNQWSANFCAGLYNLKHLNLSYNPLTSFSVDISHMKTLEKLDLSHTQLKSLPEMTRRHIDSILNSGFGIQIKIYMTHAPVLCTCANLAFVAWMSKSRAFDPRFTDYLCNSGEYTITTLQHGYNKTVADLDKECMSHTLLFVIAAGTAVLFIIVLIVFILRRFQWKLRYLYYSGYLHFKKNAGSRSEPWEYDAFICYSSDDQGFVYDVLEHEMLERNLTVILHQRDFMAGEPIAGNVVKAICSSRKTLVVLTTAMLKSSWCQYEIQIANQEAIETGRRVLVFLLMGGTPRREDNLEIFYNIKINTYSEYPHGQVDDAAHMKAFWDKLARDIAS